MEKLGSYEIIKKMDFAPGILIYQVKDPANGRSYRVKTVPDSFAYPIETHQLSNEYQLLKDCTLSCVVSVVKLEMIDGALSLIMEDPKGLTLKQFMDGRLLSISSAFEIGEGILRALLDIHSIGIVHHSVSPDVIYIDPETYQIHFSEFHLSEPMGSSVRANKFIGSNPAYMSPEQTGRTRWGVDYRTDIYSAGMTLYRLFAGRPPFDSEDLAGYYHAHIAKIPDPLTEINPDIPGIVNNILMKMIEKDPEQRYASFKGILTDFERVAHEYRRTGICSLFEIGNDDVPQNLVLSRRLFGKMELFSEIDKALSDMYFKSSFLIISGTRGMGKSRVLDLLHQEISQKSLFYVSIQLKENDLTTPYSLVMRITEALVDDLVKIRPERVSEIREMIQTIAGSNLDRIVYLFPALRPIFERSADISESIEEGQWLQRYIIDVAEYLVKAYDRVVLMVDDLHLMDDESCALVFDVFPNRLAQRFTLIGTLDPIRFANTDHGLNLETLKSSGVRFYDLKPYTYEDTLSLLRETFKKSIKRFSRLAELVWHKTAGNPYFTGILIRQLYEMGAIYYVPEYGQWDYDDIAIERLQVTDNVLDYLLKRLEQLDEQTKRVLSLAACIDMMFNVNFLRLLTSLTSEVILECLFDVEKMGLLQSLEAFEYEEGAPTSPSFAFVHSDIRNRLMAHIPEAEQRDLSKKFALALLRGIKDQDKSIPLLVRHINRCMDMELSEEIRREASRLNYLLGLNNKLLGVYGTALDYARKSVQWVEGLPMDETCYDRGLLRAELEYFNGEFSIAEHCFKQLEESCDDDLKTVQVLRIRMVLYINQGRMNDALALAQRAMDILKIPFKPQPKDFSVMLELLRFKVFYGRKALYSVDTWPLCQDSRILAQVEILMTLISVSYLVNQNLFIYVILRILNLSGKYGINSYTGFAYTIFGLVQGSALNNPKRGLAFGKQGIQLASEFGNDEILAKSHFTYGFFLNHWVNHPKENIPHLEKTIQLSYQSGDMIFYSYGVAGYILSLLDSGHLLDDVLGEVERYLVRIRDAQVEDIFNLFLLLRQFIYCLKGETDTPVSFNALNFDETAFVQRLRKSSMQSIFAVYKVVQIKLNYLFGRYDDAVAIAESLVPHTKQLMGLSVYPEYYQYYSLSLIEQPISRKGYERTLANNIKKLKNWTKYAPDNFRHKLLSVEASKKLRSGRLVEAEQLLTDALKGAQNQAFIQDEALICRLLSRCYQAMCNRKIQTVYLKDAYRLYLKWGAARLAEYVRESLAELDIMDVTESPGKPVFGVAPDLSGVTAVDVISIYKAAGVMSSEIHLDELLYKLMTYILENAGAQRAFLFMASPELRLRASANVGEPIRLYDMGDELCDFPSLLIQQVSRSGEMLLVDNLERDTMNRRDRYFEKNPSKSILVLPIHGKGQLAGVLYLENRLMSGTFTVDRVDVLTILTSQFVVSYENAILYESLRNSEAELLKHKANLEMMVETRTHELSEAHFEIRNLLDHAGQGFFSCNQDGIIRQQVSRECYRIFKRNIAGESLAALLCEYDPSNETGLTERILERAFHMESAAEWKVYLSLLPKELTLGTLELALEYQIIDDGLERRLMVILTDITETRALEQAREEEKHNLKMVARVVKHYSSFQRSLEDFIHFYLKGYTEIIRRSETPDEALQELFRMTHTYKGDLAQWGLRNTAQALHEIESILQYHLDISMPESFDEVYEITEDLEYEKTLDKDIRLLKESAGLDLLRREDLIEIPRRKILELEALLSNLGEQESLIPLKESIQRLRLKNFKDILMQYDEYIQSLAFSLDKQIDHLVIHGEDLYINPLPYGDFLKALNHVFRNMVDYGIEKPEERVQKGKEAWGLIQCRIASGMDKKIRISIWDDGGGLQIERLRMVLLNRFPDLAEDILNRSDGEIADSIFTDGISTKEDVSLISGRGLGLSAFRKETEKMGGTVSVYTEVDKGVRYEVEIPFLLE